MVQKISHELRSEKAKNIISPIPIGLIKYGILSIIGGVILLVILITFIPVRESISGNIYIEKIVLQSVDSVYVIAYADFSMDSNENLNLLKGRQIELDRMEKKIKGIIKEYDLILNKSENKECIFYLLLPDNNIENFERGISSFLIEFREVSLLRKLTSSIKIKSN